MLSVTEKPEVGTLDRAWNACIEDYPSGLAWSPNGASLATCAVSGPIHVFDVVRGSAIWSNKGHAFGTTSLAWSVDGTLLATGGQDRLCRVWDARTGTLLHTLDCADAWVEHVAYNPLGGTEKSRHLLATAAGRFVRLWGPKGDLLRTYGPHPSTVAALQWKPGTQELLSAAYGVLSTWQPSKDEPVRRYEWKGSILSIACSPDGRYVATGDQDSTIHFWKTKTGRDLQMSGYPAKVRELTWDATSRFLATGGSDVVTIWDCAKSPAGTRPLSFEGHDGLLTALAYQHRGRLLLSGAQDALILLWDPTRKTEPLAKQNLDAGIALVAWSPDDTRIAVGSVQGHIEIFNVAQELSTC
jgi:WD40 repeat protein